jgi:hypothetical protein
MKSSSLGLLAIAALLATTSAHAQGSATPTQGNPPVVRPAPVSPATTTGSAPAQPSGIGRLPNGNPERPPTSTQTHEPPAK